MTLIFMHDRCKARQKKKKKNQHHSLPLAPTCKFSTKADRFLCTIPLYRKSAQTSRRKLSLVSHTLQRFPSYVRTFFLLVHHNFQPQKESTTNKKKLQVSFFSPPSLFTHKGLRKNGKSFVFSSPHHISFETFHMF